MILWSIKQIEFAAVQVDVALSIIAHMSKRLFLLCAAIPLALIATLAIAQEQPLPDLGDRESSVLSPHEERVIGEQFLIELRRNVRTVKDPILKYFVRTNMFELAEYSDLTDTQLHSVIIDAKELNAFAAPGGIIGINLGLFRFAQDVHEYSSVVAHELAHLSQRHFARRLDQQRQLTVAQLVGFLTSAAVLASGASDAGLAGLLGTYSMVEAENLKYSRLQEREADRIGFNALTKAGYDPFGASRMFERMGTQDDAIEFLRTHPVSQKRVADLYAKAQELPDGEFQPSNDYQLMRVRALQRFVESTTSFVRNPGSMRGDGVADQYELALVLHQRGEFDLAVAKMKEVLDQMPTSILAISCYAELLTQSEKADKAISVLEEALADTPDNAPLSIMYARALKSVERFEEATSILQKQARLHSYDTDLWFELAETAGLADDIVEVHRSRAEFYALRGQFNEAISQLRLAKKANNGVSFRVDAGLDQRILELRERAEQGV